MSMDSEELQRRVVGSYRRGPKHRSPARGKNCKKKSHLVRMNPRDRLHIPLLYLSRCHEFVETPDFHTSKELLP